MNNQLKTNLPGPLSLIGQAWAIYEKHIITFVVISLITLIPSIPDVLGEANFKPPLALIILLLLVSMVISSWGTIAMLYVIKDGVGIREAFTKSLKVIFPYSWVLFLSLFIMFGGFLLFIVPGILFSIWFSMSNFIVVAENGRGMSALLKSKEYARGYFWQIAWRLIFLGIVSIIISQLPFFLSKTLNLPSQINSIYSFTYSVLSIPFSLIYGFILYKHLKLIKGDFAFEPSLKSKISHISIGILGISLIILPILFIFYLLSNNPKLVKTDGLDGLSNMILQTEMKKYYDKNGKYPEDLKDLSLSSVPFKNYTYTLENGDFKLCYPEKSQMVCVQSDSVSYSPIQ